MTKRKAPGQRAVGNDNDEHDQVSNLILQVLTEGIICLCGRSSPNTAWRKELAQMIRRTIQHHKDGTFLIRTAPALWARYQRNKRLVLVSDYGVERHVESALELAHTFLLPMVEGCCVDNNVSQHVRVDPKSGFIRVLLSTDSDPDCNLLNCPWCPMSNFASTKSLWWHLQCTHDITHHEAVDTALHQSMRDHQAIVVYDPDQTICNVPSPTTTIATTTTTLPKTDPRPVVGSETTLPTAPPDPWTCARQGRLQELEDNWPPATLITLRDSHGALLLHWAAGSGHLPVVQYLVQIGTAVDAPQQGHRSFSGRTALHWASRNGHIAVVQYLLEQNAKLEAATIDGTTAFCWAAWQGHDHILHALQAAGCCVETENRFGCTAMLWAAQGTARVETMEWLLSIPGNEDAWKKVNGSGHGVLHKAAQRGRSDVCIWVLRRIRKACLVEAAGPDNDGAVASDLAGMEGHSKLAYYLAEQEMILAKQAEASGQKLPRWLVPYSQDPSYNWEAGAGVLRMRSTLSARSPRGERAHGTR